jgi:uncharacterized protein YfdQ (DUF2303 family)
MTPTNSNVTGELLQAKDATEAASVAAIVEKCVEPKLVTITGPDGGEVPAFQAPGAVVLRSVKALIDEYRTAPERREGTATLTELESFIALVKRFADEDSALFADRSETAPSLTAVLNYHEATSEGAPRFGDHRARYDFPLSDEWKAWTAANGKAMSQADFAAFLEDRIVDVTDPISALETSKKVMEALLCSFASPSRLLDLARGLTVRVNSVVASQQNLKNGESVMRFETQHQDERGAPLEVPGAFLVTIPVFRGNDAYQLAARLRYRVKEGRVTFWYELYRATETFDHAFTEACKRASSETELPLYMGKPES